jgi:sugar/nucleoside kinase (ribokinase family)
MDPQIMVVGHIINETIVYPDRIIAPVLGSPAAYSSVISTVLGAQAGLVTKVGQDFPPELFEPLREAGVDLRGVSAGHEHSTANIMTYSKEGTKSMRYKTRAPEILFSDVPAAYYGAELIFVCPMHYDVPLATLEELCKLPGSIVVDLGGFGGATCETHPSPEEWADNRLIKALAQMVDVVKASVEDCRHILPNDLTPEQLARAFVGWGARIGLITLGQEGALAVEGDRVYTVPSFPATVDDVTGAGDAFSAGFLVEYLRSHDVQQAMRFGCGTASVLIESTGGVKVARMPRQDDVKHRIGLLV